MEPEVGDRDSSGSQGADTDWKRSVGGLVLLIPVLGFLWVVLHYVPKLGDVMETAADRLVERGAAEEAPSEMEENGALPEETPGKGGSPGSDSVSAREGGSLLGAFRAQIIEQLGGDGVEVRHLALSDDETRMVAALRVVDGEGESELIEVFFERDEFGRYRSTKDAPMEEPLTLWSE